jgi:hypothetical protein
MSSPHVSPRPPSPAPAATSCPTHSVAASLSSSSLSPAAAPFFPSGLSKAQQWKDASPSVDTSEDPPSPPARPFYRDVVASRPAPVKKPPPLSQQPRQLASVVGFCSFPCPKDDGGWQRVEGRRARHRRLRQSRPCRRGFPEDLRGKCFNCLSSGHRAATCRRPTCCFRCSEPGHRSSKCPRRLAASRQPRFPTRQQRRVAWRPTPAQRAAPSPQRMAGNHPPLCRASGAPGVGGGRRLLVHVVLRLRPLC